MAHISIAFQLLFLSVFALTSYSCQVLNKRRAVEQQNCVISAELTYRSSNASSKVNFDCGTFQYFEPIAINYNQYANVVKLIWNGSAASANMYRLGLDTIIDPSTASVNRLTHLEICNFQTDILRRNTFYNFANLRFVGLEHNYVRLIENDAFNHLVALEELVLKYNNIENIDWHTFSELISLQKLTIEETRVRKLNVNLTALVNLRDLHIIGAQSVSKGSVYSVFFGTGVPRALQAVTISNSIIETNFTLRIGSEDSETLKNLQFLSLTSCNLSLISITVPYLKMLNLSANTIRSEVYLQLYGMDSLKILDLSHNQLKSLRNRLCDSCVRLEKLYLNDNRIHFIAFNALSVNKKLELLDLSSNQLQLLTTSVHKFLEFPDIIVVDDNPWECQWVERIVDDNFFEKFKFLPDTGRVNVKGLGCHAYAVTNKAVDELEQPSSQPSVEGKSEKSMKDDVDHSNEDASTRFLLTFFCCVSFLIFALLAYQQKDVILENPCCSFLLTRRLGALEY